MAEEFGIGKEGFLQRVKFEEEDTESLDRDENGKLVEVWNAKTALAQALKLPALSHLNPEIHIPQNKETEGENGEKEIEDKIEILVDFPTSDPLFKIRIREYPITNAQGQEVRRVDVIFQRGFDVKGVAFENGKRQLGNSFQTFQPNHCQ